MGSRIVSGCAYNELCVEPKEFDMPQVKPIPEGMHTVTPHLVCAGAAEAIELNFS
jgi:hypothetical protein